MTPTPEQSAKRVIELSEKATKGPWVHREWDECQSPIYAEDQSNPMIAVVSVGEGRAHGYDNRKLITEYRTAAPELARAYLKLETELQQLRLAADGMRDEVEKAPHGPDCKLGQPVTRFGRPPGSRGDMPCTCWKSRATAAYRAAGEGQTNNASNSPTDSRDSQG